MNTQKWSKLLIVPEVSCLALTNLQCFKGNSRCDPYVQRWWALNALCTSPIPHNMFLCMRPCLLKIIWIVLLTHIDTALPPSISSQNQYGGLGSLIYIMISYLTTDPFEPHDTCLPPAWRFISCRLVKWQEFKQLRKTSGCVVYFTFHHHNCHK